MSPRLVCDERLKTGPHGDSEGREGVLGGAASVQKQRLLSASSLRVSIVSTSVGRSKPLQDPLAARDRQRASASYVLVRIHSKRAGADSVAPLQATGPSASDGGS